MANIPDLAVGFVSDNLKELVKNSADRLGGLEDFVYNLCDDLDFLEGFLKQCRKMPDDDDEFLRNLMNNVADTVRRAEDLIETYIVESSRQKANDISDWILDLQYAGKQIAEVRAKVFDFCQNKAQLGHEVLNIEQTSSGGRAAKQRQMNAAEEDNVVVGLEDEVEEFISAALTRGTKMLHLLPIVGFTGIGKTTLAEKIFNDPRFNLEWDIRAFVYVSEKYEKKKVFLKLLSYFTQITEELNNMSDEELVTEIQKQLKTEKYLIILDDVPTKEAWDDLKVAFPENLMCSMILITSRNNTVIHCSESDFYPFYMRFLLPYESQELLLTNAFGENSCPMEFEEHEQYSILNACDGIPLAIKIVAGILRNLPAEVDGWKKVTSQMYNYTQGDGVLPYYKLMRLNFNNLPYHLKLCFLYLGAFSEEFDIPAWKLLRMWISEGFIERNGDMSVEHIAEDYLKELVERNLVKVGQRRSNGQIKTCRMDAPILDFCRKEAVKENRYQEINRFDQDTYSFAIPSLDNCRRICVKSDVLDFISSKASGKHVRTFLCFAKDKLTLHPEHISFLPRAFKLLRVLDLSSIRFICFPVELHHLFLLRYIAIICNFIILPEEMSNLSNLQTLIIETSSDFCKVEVDILKMTELRHLHVNVPTCLEKVDKDSSVNASLQTLTKISIESCTKDLLERTPNLKNLGIHGRLATFLGENSESGLFDSLLNLEYLQTLKLLNNDSKSRLHALPHENMFPSKLTSLTLSNTGLEWKHMSTLGNLRTLQVLKLKDNAFQGELWKTEDGGFRYLKFLHIGSTNIVVWNASSCHFPILECLAIKHCSKLKAVPPGLAYVPSLCKIDLYWTSSSLASSARKIRLIKAADQEEENVIRNRKLKLSVVSLKV